MATIYPGQKSNHGKAALTLKVHARRPYGHAPRTRLGAPRRLW